MDALEIKISLPETLAREAEAMGLLAPEAIEALFSAELDRRAHAEEVAAIQIGIDEFERGEGRPAREVLEEIAAKQGVWPFDFKAAQQEAAGLWPEEDSADDFVAAVREWRQQGVIDNVGRHRQIIQHVIEQSATMFSEGNRIAILPVCDPVHDEYLLISLGRHHEGREHDIVFHAQFRDGKVLILDDRTEEGIAPFLIEAGIEDSDIEVAWASRRQMDNSAALAA